MNYEYIKKLRNKQKDAYNEAMGIREKLEDEQTLLDDEGVAEAKAHFKRCMAAYDEAEDEIKEHEKFEAIKASRSEYIDKAKHENPKANAERDIDVNRKIMEYRIRYARDKEYPKHVQDFFNEHRANAQSTTDGKGGYHVTDDWWKEVNVAMSYIGPMLNRELVNYVTSDKGGSLYFQRIDDTAQEGYYVAEAGDLTTSAEDLDWTQVELNAYKYHSGLLEVSHELLQDSGIDILDHIRDLCVTRLVRGLNTAFTTGDGTYIQGFCEVAAAAGFTEKGEDFGANAVTKTDLLNLYHSIDPAYRAKPSCAWQMLDSTLAILRALDVSTDGGLIWQPSFATGGAPTLLGCPYYLNPAMEDVGSINRPIFFGDWKQYTVREVSPITFKTDDSVYFAKDSLAVDVLGRWDGDVTGYVDGVKFGRCATT